MEQENGVRLNWSHVFLSYKNMITIRLKRLIFFNSFSPNYVVLGMIRFALISPLWFQ